MRAMKPAAVASAIFAFALATAALAQEEVAPAAAKEDAASAASAAAQEEAPAATPEETVAEAPMPKGQELFATCSACHGETGTSMIPLYPSLAGQFPEYLISQFLAFKNGARQDETMQPFADMTSEEDAREAIAWVTSQKLQPEAPEEPQDTSVGERIYRGGIMDRRIPSCAACHGPDGSGIAVQYPSLAGQHADYTIKQLTAFRDGTRTTNQPMADVAAKMNDKEIEAVAAYIARMR